MRTKLQEKSEQDLGNYPSTIAPHLTTLIMYSAFRPDNLNWSFGEKASFGVSVKGLYRSLVECGKMRTADVLSLGFSDYVSCEQTKLRTSVHKSSDRRLRLPV